MDCRFDIIGTCTSYRYHDNGTATCKNLGPINTQLNVFDRELFACKYASNASPFRPEWASLDFICHRDKYSTTSQNLDRSKRTKCVENIIIFPMISTKLRLISLQIN